MIYIVGTGRCGTKTLAQLVGGLHEPEPRIIKEATDYYQSDYTTLDSLKAKLRERAKFDTVCISDHKQSTVIPLIREIDAKAEFVVLIREPLSCIASFVNRQWFRRPGSRWDDNRLRPSGGFPENWTQRMQCGWLWVETNQVLFDCLADHSFDLVLTSELGEIALNATQNKVPLELTEKEQEFCDQHVFPFWEQVLVQRQHVKESLCIREAINL